jgi:hypothetical protein
MPEALREREEEREEDIKKCGNILFVFSFYFTMNMAIFSSL